MPNQKPAWVMLMAAFGVLAVAGPIAAGAYFYPNIERYMHVKWMAQDDAFFWKTPVPLGDFSVASAKGVPLDYAGVTFSVPWDVATDVAPSSNGLDQVSILFQPKLTVSVTALRPGEIIRVPIPRKNRAGNDEQSFIDMSIPDYGPLRKTLYATPASVPILASRAKSQAATELLFGKLFVRQNHDDQIFAVSAPRCRGFQLGSAVVNYWGVELYLYTAKHNVHIRVARARPDAQEPVTQADINLIVQTMRDAN